MGTYGDDLPWRFMLRDLYGQYADYQFHINPTSYKLDESETRVGFHVSLAGSRRVIKFGKKPEIRVMEWERIHRDMYLALRDRYDSGNTFYLYDHNKLDVVGVLDEFDFEEITATVPSDYKGRLKIVGVGKPEPRDWNYYGE